MYSPLTKFWSQSWTVESGKAWLMRAAFGSSLVIINLPTVLADTAISPEFITFTEILPMNGNFTNYKLIKILTLAFVQVAVIFVLFKTSIISIHPWIQLNKMYSKMHFTIGIECWAQSWAFLRQSTWWHFGSRLQRLCRFLSEQKLISGKDRI